MVPVRTFIAFDTPPPIRDEMTLLQTALRESGADVRWESAGNFHATIKFLGDVDHSRLSGITALVQSVCSQHRPFEVSFEGLGVFPALRHPKVLWVGCVNDDGSLALLKTALDTALTPHGFSPEGRSFRPHVTLGRMRSERGLEHLTPKLEKLTFEPRTGTISEILVMKSVLRPQGAEYTRLTSIRLQS